MEPITMALIGGGVGGLLDIIGQEQARVQAEELQGKQKAQAKKREEGIIGTAFSNALARMGGGQGIELNPIRYEPQVTPQINPFSALKSAAAGGAAGLLAGQAMQGNQKLLNVLSDAGDLTDIQQFQQNPILAPYINFGKYA